MKDDGSTVITLESEAAQIQRMLERQPLNQFECHSLSALSTYVARSIGVTNEAIESMLAAACNADCLQDIKMAKYDDAVRFLVDLAEKDSMPN